MGTRELLYQMFDDRLRNPEELPEFIEEIMNIINRDISKSLNDIVKIIMKVNETREQRENQKY